MNMLKRVKLCLQQGGDTFNICCNDIIIILICYYNLFINITFYFGLRDFRDTRRNGDEAVAGSMQIMPTCTYKCHQISKNLKADGRTKAAQVHEVKMTSEMAN